MDAFLNKYHYTILNTTMFNQVGDKELKNQLFSSFQITIARSCRRRRSALQQRLKSMSSDTAIFDEKEVIC